MTLCRKGTKGAYKKRKTAEKNPRVEKEVKVISHGGKYRRDEKKEKGSVNRDSQRDPNNDE